MSPYYRRKKPGYQENTGAALAALGVAAGVAGVTFYLVRLLLSREPLSSGKPAELSLPGRVALPRGDDPPGPEEEEKA
jgi:hypothetical protein